MKHLCCVYKKIKQNKIENRSFKVLVSKRFKSNSDRPCSKTGYIYDRTIISNIVRSAEAKCSKRTFFVLRKGKTNEI